VIDLGELVGLGLRGINREGAEGVVCFFEAGALLDGRVLFSFLGLVGRGGRFPDGKPRRGTGESTGEEAVGDLGGRASTKELGGFI
jgi:hypothetical protein